MDIKVVSIFYFFIKYIIVKVFGHIYIYEGMYLRYILGQSYRRSISICQIIPTYTLASSEALCYFHQDRPFFLPLWRVWLYISLTKRWCIFSTFIKPYLFCELPILVFYKICWFSYSFHLTAVYVPSTFS